MLSERDVKGGKIVAKEIRFHQINFSDTSY